MAVMQLTTCIGFVDVFFFFFSKLYEKKSGLDVLVRNNMEKQLPVRMQQEFHKVSQTLPDWETVKSVVTLVWFLT